LSINEIAEGAVIAMRARLGIVCALLILAWAIATTYDFPHAQIQIPSSTIVEHSLLSLIKKLQDETDGQTTSYDSPIVSRRIDPTLKELGTPIRAFLGNPIAAQGLINFNAYVVHEVGRSTWSLGTFENGEIATIDLTALDRRIVDVRGQGKPAIPPPIIDPRIVEFLFASTRQEGVQSSTENIGYSGERGMLTYGAASVRIPDDHKIGRIELPSSWKLFGMTLSSSTSEHERFIIKRVVPLSESAFSQIIKNKGANSALIFVHGFNTSFDDALYRCAQITWDLQYKGLPILFTWASRGEVIDYLYDRESAYLARDAFVSLLQKLRRDFKVEQVVVLAHSMGNVVVLDSLANYAHTSNPLNIARLIMAAPDVDRDQFKVLAASAKAIVGGMTLYASSADRAMVISKRLAGGVPRAGDVPIDGPVVLPDVETIDVTAMGNDIFGLNHNVFAASRDVMEDISILLRSNLPSPRLIQIRAVPEAPATVRYWRYAP
jgi:esterase/lipase superfamily enzyme